MEYIEGVSLKTLIDPEEDITFDKKLDIMVSLLRTLEFIHSRNVIHWDVKPSNIKIKNEVMIRNWFFLFCKTSDIIEFSQKLFSSYCFYKQFS